MKLFTWLFGEKVTPSAPKHIKKIPRAQVATLKKITARVTGRKFWKPEFKTARLEATAAAMLDGKTIVAYGDIAERQINGTAFVAITQDFYVTE